MFGDQQDNTGYHSLNRYDEEGAYRPQVSYLPQLNPQNRKRFKMANSLGDDVLLTGAMLLLILNGHCFSDDVQQGVYVFAGLYTLYKTLNAKYNKDSAQQAHRQALLGTLQRNAVEPGQQQPQVDAKNYVLTVSQLNKYQNGWNSWLMSACNFLTFVGLVASPICYATDNPQYGIASLFAGLGFYFMSGVCEYRRGSKLYAQVHRDNSDNSLNSSNANASKEYEPKLTKNILGLGLTGLIFAGAGAGILFRFYRDLSQAIDQGNADANPHITGMVVSQLLMAAGLGLIASIGSSLGLDAYEKAIEHTTYGTGVYANTVTYAGVNMNKSMVEDISALPIIAALAATGYYAVQSAEVDPATVIAGALGFSMLYRIYSLMVQSTHDQITNRIMDNNQRFGVEEQPASFIRGVKNLICCGN